MIKKQLILFLILSFSISKTYAQITDTLIVYPNPFQDTAIIEFDINQTDTVSLNVYSTTGVNVRTYFQDSILSAGNYSITLIGYGLLQGIYFIKLKINSVMLSKKIIKNGGATALNENESDKSDLFLFPNPTKDILNINYILSSNSKTQIQIINSIGQTIKEISTQQPIGTYTVTVDTKQFANGIYYIIFSDGVNTKQEKFLIE